MKRLPVVFYLWMSAVGGLLAFPAIPGYFVWTLIPTLYAVIVYVALPPCQRKWFAVLAAANLLMGCVLHWLPHVPSGGLGGLGILILVVFLLIDGRVSWSAFRQMAKDDTPALAEPGP